MKRRGVKPTATTYATMMMGYGLIDDWSKFPKQLENCIAVHEQYYENRREITTRPEDIQSGSHTTCRFFTILSKVNLHDKIFDVFNQMDHRGPWAPNAHVYGAILGALPYRVHSKTTDGLSFHERNASDAKLLWKQMKDAESDGIAALDDYVVARFISLLAKGRPADQQFALEVAKEYAGYNAPGELAQPAKVSVSPNLRLSVLLLLRRLGRSRLIMSYTNQLLEVDDANMAVWGRSVFEAFHDISTKAPSDESVKSLEFLKKMLLEAARRSDETFRPTMNNYETALMVCWRCADWRSACETFNLMTGYRAVDFAPTQSRNPSDQDLVVPKPTLRSAGLNLTPTNLAMLNLVRTAVASNDGDIMLQCWDMYSYFFGVVPPRASGWNSFKLRPIEHAPYFNLTFARYIAKLIDGCLSLAEPAKAEGMVSLRKWAQRTIDETSPYKLSVPYMEKATGDSPDEGSKLKEAIDFELQLRNAHTH